MIITKKNILFVNGHLNVGGVERSLVDVLKHFNYNKYNVDLLLLEGTGDYLDEIPKNVNIINKDTRPAFGPIATSIKQNIRTRNWFAIKYRIILTLIKFVGNRVYNLLPKLSYIFFIKMIHPVSFSYHIRWYWSTKALVLQCIRLNTTVSALWYCSDEKV